MTRAPTRLRVAVAAGDPAMVRKLAALVADSGHEVVAIGAAPDALLTDATVDAAPGIPIVALEEADGGCAGSLAPEAGPAEIDAAIRAVAAGLAVRVRRPPRVRFGPLPEVRSPVLTPREIEVLAALALGLGNKAVARRLAISPHTVKFHLEGLFRKLGVTSRAEAVAKGLRQQIVEF